MATSQSADPLFNMLASRSLWQRTLGLVVLILAACGGSGSSDNPVPTASIVVAATVPVNALVIVSGAGSASGSGGALTYSWTLTSKPAGSAAVLSNPTTVQPTFTPDVVGTYTFGLAVNDGKNTTSVSGSTTASVIAPPTITSDIVEPLSGSVMLGLSSDPGSYTPTWTIDGTALGTVSPVAWDTTTVANGAHVASVVVQYTGNYSFTVTRTFQVTQSPVVLSSSAISASNGLITGLVAATSVNGIVTVSATLDGVGIGSLAVPNACTDSTGVACASTGLNAFSFSGAVTAGAHVVVITATDGIGKSLGIQLRLTTT